MLAAMVKASGAHSTQPVDKEDVDELTAKCTSAAAKWTPVSEKLWAGELPHYSEVQKMKDEEQQRNRAVLEKKLKKTKDDASLEAAS